MVSHRPTPVPGPVPGSPMADAPLRPAAEPFHVLAAEDEPHTCRILSTLLEGSGIHLEIVCDGAAALSAVRGESPYDLFLLDVMMPKASGLDVLSEIRSLHRRAKTPVIVLTAKGQDADREEALSLGANAFLTKPFSPKKLLNLVDELLARR
ncbi:MAG: response regulator [Gemmatimonadetes bacterium]|nr:response regulator [Gemmatimonadota bacterium]